MSTHGTINTNENWAMDNNPRLTTWLPQLIASLAPPIGGEPYLESYIRYFLALLFKLFFFPHLYIVFKSLF